MKDTQLEAIARKFIDDYRSCEITKVEDDGFLVTRPSGFSDFIDEDKVDEWLADRLVKELQSYANQKMRETAQRFLNMKADNKYQPSGGISNGWLIETSRVHRLAEEIIESTTQDTKENND